MVRDESSIISISEDPTITNAKIEEVLSFIESLPKEKKTDILELFGSQHLTNEDINILLGRKKSLEIFELHLKNLDWEEKEWQQFFEENSWIFGYGLNYQYLKILQREGHISNVDLNGKNEVIIDFLMASSNFTILVELKRPDTPLFGTQIERSETWKLSTDLHSALSQILAQKAEWQLKSESENYDSNNKLIKQKTVDPKTILIIGSSNQYSGEENKVNKIKSRTFELFRRNSRNIDIITYDELYARAYYIVFQQQL